MNSIEIVIPFVLHPKAYYLDKDITLLIKYSILLSKSEVFGNFN